MVQKPCLLLCADVEESDRPALMEMLTLLVLTLGHVDVSHQALDADLTQMAAVQGLYQTTSAQAKGDDLQFVTLLREL